MHRDLFDNRFLDLFDKKIVLYGAGITGIETHKVLVNYFSGVDVLCFCDTHKTGTLGGIPIITPEQLEQISATGEIVVIITALAANHEGIVRKLQNLRIPPSLIYTLAEMDELVAYHSDDTRVSGWYRAIRHNKLKLSRREGNNTYLDWWCPEHFCSGDVLVYQCGKVGSSTICNSLASVGVSATHVHMLTDRFIYDIIPELAWEPSAAQAKIIAKSSKRCIDRIQAEGALKIVTLVREPLSRDFSGFVYHLRELIESGYLAPSDSLEHPCANGMKRRATQNGKSANGYQFDWFDGELKTVFGIDVYAQPFDTDRGFTIIRRGGVEVLVLKLEKLYQLQSIIGAFVGAPDFRLVNSNQSSKKDYSDLYKQLREKVRLPVEVADLYYDGNSYMNHFYSQAERDRFMSNWRANLVFDVERGKI